MSERGKIKFYNAEKGFGFIKQEGEKRDIHFDNGSFKGNPPSEGDEVEFNVVKQSKGPHAVNLRIVSGSSYESEDVRYMLPKDTKKIIDAQTIDNFALKLNKAARFGGGKFEFFKTDRGKVIYQIKANISKEMVENISNRYYGFMEKLNLKLSEKLIVKPDWRMVVGLGNESVYETSMTLHHIYGIPYIPGSAIKGVVRNYIITEQFEQNEEEALLKDKGFCLIFGSPKNSSIGEHKGNVIFFDAYPLEPPNIEPDVMNVHYPDYYGGDKPPADFQNPNPIFFLTVRETHFKFMMGIKNSEDKEIGESKLVENIDKLSENFTLLETAFYWLKRALSEHGIGAKTAVGYGYMNI